MRKIKIKRQNEKTRKINSIIFHFNNKKNVSSSISIDHNRGPN